MADFPSQALPAEDSGRWLDAGHERLFAMRWRDNVIYTPPRSYGAEISLSGRVGRSSLKEFWGVHLL